jgi:hypothetical protein
MATYSIKSLLLALTVAGTILPTTAMAGPAATQVNAPTEIWDVAAPHAETKTVASHMDVQPGQGFDAPGTVVPMNVTFISRAEFEGSVQATEMWDAAPTNAASKAVGDSHFDIQPGQSFDYPAPTAPQAQNNVLTSSARMITSPDA